MGLTYCIMTQIIFIVSLSLIYPTFGDSAKDLACFDDNFKNSSQRTTSQYNSTYLVRVEHEGDVADYFKDGNLHNLTLNDVVKINTKAKTIGTFCSIVRLFTDKTLPFCKAEEARVLSSVYNGTHICGGIGEKLTTFKKETEELSEEWKNCDYKCSKVDAPEMELRFTYATYRQVNKEGRETDLLDVLVVKGGAADHFGSLGMLLSIAFLNRFL